VDSRKEAGTVVVVKVLVLAHIINLLPLGLRHLLLHQFWCHFFLIRVKTTVLPINTETRNTSHHRRLIPFGELNP